MKWGNWKGEHSLSTHRCEIIGEGLQAWTRECDDCNHTIHSPQCHMFAPHWLKSCTHAHTHSIASTCGIGKKQVSVCFCPIFLIMLKRQSDSEWTAFFILERYARSIVWRCDWQLAVNKESTDRIRWHWQHQEEHHQRFNGQQPEKRSERYSRDSVSLAKGHTKSTSEARRAVQYCNVTSVVHPPVCHQHSNDLHHV